MNRAFFGALCCAGMLFWCAKPARATTEFCPAVLDSAPVPAGANSSQTYGIQLRALSARSISATLAFDTSSGWYQVEVPSAGLTGTTRTLDVTGPSDVSLYASAVMYVRFPSSVHVNHAFVTNALSANDAFGWSARGSVTCTPAAETFPGTHSSLADGPALSVAPAANSLILAAKPHAPLEAASCAKPFRDAKLLQQGPLARAAAAREYGESGTSIVSVALNPNGSVADTWVASSSGYAYLDDVTLTAAKASTYTPARAYCQNIPSIYYFAATFRLGPHSRE